MAERLGDKFELEIFRPAVYYSSEFEVCLGSILIDKINMISIYYNLGLYMTMSKYGDINPKPCATFWRNKYAVSTRGDT